MTVEIGVETEVPTEAKKLIVLVAVVVCSGGVMLLGP